MPRMYGWVREVVPEGPADRADIQPGDLIRTIDGHLIRDLVDYRFYVADEDLTIGFERQQSAHEVQSLRRSIMRKSKKITNIGSHGYVHK